jgi:hypothetical protein
MGITIQASDVVSETVNVKELESEGASEDESSVVVSAGVPVETESGTGIGVGLPDSVAFDVELEGSAVVLFEDIRDGTIGRRIATTKLSIDLGTLGTRLALLQTLGEARSRTL